MTSTFRTCCKEDKCYQRVVGWGGTIRTSALENQPAKTSVESSSWSFSGLFARSFTGPFDHSCTGVLGSVIHRALRAVFQRSGLVATSTHATRDWLAGAGRFEPLR